MDGYSHSLEQVIIKDIVRQNELEQTGFTPVLRTFKKQPL